MQTGVCVCVVCVTHFLISSSMDMFASSSSSSSSCFTAFCLPWAPSSLASASSSSANVSSSSYVHINIHTDAHPGHKGFFVVL